VQWQQVECDLHEASVRRRPADGLRCVACRALNAPDGFARGSHRPLMTEDCTTCVGEARAAASAAAAACGGCDVRVAAACDGCDDCRNCSAASTFDALHAAFCRPLGIMEVLAIAAWPEGARLAGRDEFK